VLRGWGGRPADRADSTGWRSRSGDRSCAVSKKRWEQERVLTPVPSGHDRTLFKTCEGRAGRANPINLRTCITDLAVKALWGLGLAGRGRSVSTAIGCASRWARAGSSRVGRGCGRHESGGAHTHRGA
jgi:hypothetical protein